MFVRVKLCLPGRRAEAGSESCPCTRRAHTHTHKTVALGSKFQGYWGWVLEVGNNESYIRKNTVLHKTKGTPTNITSLVFSLEPIFLNISTSMSWVLFERRLDLEDDPCCKKAENIMGPMTQLA